LSVRVVIVDDSATMRGLIAATLAQDNEIEIVAACADCREARAAIKALSPDVVTLDIEMPEINGLEFLERIMRLRPMPVIMVSAMTQEGAEISLRALELGAFDCIAKPAGLGPEPFPLLVEKVKAAARSRPHRRLAAQTRGPALAARAGGAYHPDGRVIAIGSSTGGVEALVQILTEFPANCPPTIISQHLPAMFTKTFAERLNRTCRPNIREAFDGAPLRPGDIYLAPGNAHLELTRGPQPHCRLSDAEPVNRHRPSVDVMFQSAAATLGPKAIGVILTGMGRDGAAGLLAMRRAGAETIGQDEASSIVYGMPRTAQELGAVMRQLPLGKIAARLLQLCNSSQQELTA